MVIIDELPISAAREAEGRALGALNDLMDVLGLTSKQEERLDDV